MRLIELYNDYVKENQWLIDIAPLHNILFESGYIENHTMIDNFFTNYYADLIIDDNILDSTDSAKVQMAILSFLYSNIEMIKRLYEIQVSEYNLLDNMDKYELLDKQNIQFLNGKQKTTMINGKVNTINTNKVSGFDSNELVIDNVNETLSTGINGGNIENTVENDEYTNNQIISGTGEDGKIYNHVHGNVGVTMTTQLLDAHADFWNNFNFFEKVLKSLFNYLCVGVYE